MKIEFSFGSILVIAMTALAIAGLQHIAQRAAMDQQSELQRFLLTNSSTIVIPQKGSGKIGSGDRACAEGVIPGFWASERCNGLQCAAIGQIFADPEVADRPERVGSTPRLKAVPRGRETEHARRVRSPEVFR